MIQVLNRKIGGNSPPFIIAEMSGNHNQSLERALEIVDIAASTGVDAIKIQTYTPDTMTLNLNDREFLIADKSSVWKGKSLYKLYEEAHTPWEWHQSIFQRALKRGIIPFSTPFDKTSVDFLESLSVPLYKIASFEITDLDLIKRVSETGKPVIISTGMANLSEIDDAVRTARRAGCVELILLKCTSTYPAAPTDTNLLTIPHMRQMFECEIGLSDHTMGIGVALASIALGASVIEKHFTLNRFDGGVDSTFSMEPSEMTQLVTESRRSWESLGTINYSFTKAEENSLKFRRSLYITKPLKAGDLLTLDNVRAIRPGLGLPPKYLNDVLGKTIKIDAVEGTALNWDLIR